MECRSKLASAHNPLLPEPQRSAGEEAYKMSVRKPSTMQLGRQSRALTLCASKYSGGSPGRAASRMIAKPVTICTRKHACFTPTRMRTHPCKTPMRARVLDTHDPAPHLLQLLGVVDKHLHAHHHAGLLEVHV